MTEHQEAQPVEPADEGDAPAGAVSAADLMEDPGEPEKGVQWDAPERAKQATESAAAAAAEDA